MNELSEKSKRSEKRKGEPRRNRLVIAGIITMILLAAGMLLLLALPLCCSPGNSMFEQTATSIQQTNAQVAMLLTETAFADLNLTSGPPREYWWTETAVMDATATAYEVNRQASMTATAQAEQTAIALMTDVTDGGGLAMITPDASATPSPVAGLTATKTCYWSWNTQNDTEFAQRLQVVLEEAGVEVVSVNVSAHGEDYICTEDGAQTKEFHLMDRSPTISLPESRGETRAAMGARIEQVLRAIKSMNIGGLYRIEIIFASSGTESVMWRMDYAEAHEALNSGKTGAELFEAGQGG